jgi:protein-disulfide isomerase
MGNKPLFAARIISVAPRLSWLVATACCLPPPSHAQQVEPTSDELRALLNDVREMKLQQTKLLEGMEDIKRLVSSSSSATTAAVPPVVTEVSGDQFRGDSAATVVIIEYGDFECVFCREFERDTYPQIRDAYILSGKVRYYFRDLPLQIHPFAMASARAARCATEQSRFWQMHDELLRGEAQLTPGDIDRHAQKIGIDIGRLDACMASDRYAEAIRNSAQSAGKFGIRGTPTFLIGNLDSNGTTVTIKTTMKGSQPFASFKTALDPFFGAPRVADSPAENRINAGAR